MLRVMGIGTATISPAGSTSYRKNNGKVSYGAVLPIRCIALFYGTVGRYVYINGV